MKSPWNDIYLNISKQLNSLYVVVINAIKSVMLN